MAKADLRFLHGGHTPRCNARVDKHFVGYHTLQYSTRGSVELFYGRERHVLGACSFWPAHPGPRIRFHPAPGTQWWEHRYVAFQGPLVQRWEKEGLLAPAPMGAPRGEAHAVGFDQMLRLFRAGDAWSHRRAVNQLEGLLLELAQARHAPKSSRQEPWVALVHARLEPGDKTEPDYAALAEELGMGLSTLRRRFRQATGVSLHAHALSARMQRARAMLVGSDLPIKAVAQKLGYRDVYFFSRQFREKVGVTPGVFRRSRVE